MVNAFWPYSAQVERSCDRNVPGAQSTPSRPQRSTSPSLAKAGPAQGCTRPAPGAAALARQGFDAVLALVNEDQKLADLGSVSWKAQPMPIACGPFLQPLAGRVFGR